MLAEGGGISAVAVEPLAAKVGATKGSAYWHFPNRDALLLATVERWEHEHRVVMRAGIDAMEDPLGKLRLIFSGVHEVGDCAIEAALLAAADDPIVAPVLKRVTDGRIQYLEELFRALGFSAEASARRAVLAYSVYLGQAQLIATTPHVVAEHRALIDDTLTALSTA